MSIGNALTCRLMIGGDGLVSTLVKISWLLTRGFVALRGGPRKRAWPVVSTILPTTISGSHVGRC